MDRRYSKRYRQTFPSDNAHKSLLETIQAIGLSSFTCGAKRTLKPTAVPSVFHWKKRSLVKRKAPTRRGPIKGIKATEKTTAKADLPTCDSTCEVFLEPQETPFLSSITENLQDTRVDQPADDSQSRELKQRRFLAADVNRKFMFLHFWKWRN